MKVTASVTKSLGQDSSPCCLHFFFFNTCTVLFCWKIKSCCNHWFPQQIRPQITDQLYILRDYSSFLRIGFNMIRLSRLSFDRYCFTQS